MLRDRRVLMAQELLKQKQACGQLYKKIVLGNVDYVEGQMYESMKQKLADMTIELSIVDQMISDGHQ
jgi:hypothetical protein